MAIGRGRDAAAVLGLLVAAGGCAPAEGAPEVLEGVPHLEVEAGWSPLPSHWILGSGLGVFVDARDHLWLSHHQEQVTEEIIEAARERDPANSECCVPAPLVMEFDPQGNLVQAWGRHDEAHDLPEVLHGFFVDHNDYVWTTARDQHQIMKFTRDGQHLLTLGHYREVGGSNDPERFGRPADVWVHPRTNELFVADGYTNRRVIVLDAETGAYLRHWGAYGEAPVDGPGGGRGAGAGETGEGAGPPTRFATVHGITGSHDELLYVADRSNSRVQVFRPDGEFVMERIIREGSGAAFDVALSHDQAQRFLYVTDGTQHKVWILERATLEVVGEFGSQGFEPGQFGRPHNLEVDSRGNLYITEADPGRRIQRFAFAGTHP